VPDVVLLTVAGLQVPVIPLLEVVDKIGAVVPVQNAGMAVNVGVVPLKTVTLVVVLLQVVDVFVKVNVALPTLMPVITPALVTVAIVLLLLVHVPPVVGLKVVVLPTQTEGGAVTVGFGDTVTVTFFVRGQTMVPIEPEVTVYVIVAVGVAITVAPVVALKLVAGLQVYVPLPPLAVSETPGLPTHIVGALGVTFNTFTPDIAVIL
jgi:hypothetical protein